MLELKEIRKSYLVGGVRQEVLRGISICFRKNEFASILGSSGSGKTTLLNIIGGLDGYDSGDQVIEGVSTQHYSTRDWDAYRNYRVGFIFQNYNLIMHQSVFSNVEIALTLSGISKAERQQRVREVLERVGLGEHMDKNPNQLSGGQMQRVAIARALVNNPEIILADEPTGALDSVTSIQIMDLLKEIAQDRLVIMVTHNPEIARKYSTRIIELKDGQIIQDSDPYNGEEETQPAQRAMKKTNMSMRASLGLSFRNLMTKKGRTFLTALAGSIGIIGIALILSLSNGVNSMVSQMEKDSMSDYPIKIERSSFNLMETLSMALKAGGTKNETTHEEGKLYSSDDVVSPAVFSPEGLMHKNNIREFKGFLDQNQDIADYADSINDNYDLALQVFRGDTKINPPEDSTSADTDLFRELTEKNHEFDSKYQLLAGRMPEEKEEVVLVVGSDSVIPDSVLYALGVKSQDELMGYVSEFSKDSSFKVPESEYDYQDFIGRSYKLILNTDYFTEDNGSFTDHSLDTAYMKGIIENGTDLTIVGVITEEGGSQCYIGFRHDLTIDVLDQIMKTDLYAQQMADKSVNVLTGEKLDGIRNSFDTLAYQYGYYEFEDPSSISIYPKDYASKEKIVELIKSYNDEKTAEGKKDLVIQYTDVMKDLTGGIKRVVNIISYVLIAFVAISLIVSSLMIGIITYISVLERTKEIGILRAIGASRKDIKRVFRAETVIEGFAAGTLGIIITLLLSVPINAIVKATANIDGIAKLPPAGAVILILISILLNVIAGSKPAGMAARKNPVEALRTE